MRILFLTPAYPPSRGGGERYTRSLALELVNRGHEITAVTSQATLEPQFWQGTPTQQVTQETDGAIQLIRCPIRPIVGGHSALMAWRKLMVMGSLVHIPPSFLQWMARQIPPIQQMAQQLEKLGNQFDLIHAFNLSWEYPMLLGGSYAKRWQRPFVVTPFAHLANKRVALNNTMRHQTNVLAQAQAVLTLTDVEIRDFKQYNVPLQHAVTIDGGLDPFDGKPDPTVLTNLPRPFALFIGRANQDKGATHAIQAIAQLASAGKSISLVLAGQRTTEFDIAYNALTDQQKRSIQHVGLVSEAQKQALLAKCAMLLLPSHSDSFGIVFLEAWAHSKPVIGANAGGIPGVVDDQINGLLVPYGNVRALATAVQTLLHQPALAKQLGQAGQQKVQKRYQWEQVATKVETVYQQILEAS